MGERTREALLERALLMRDMMDGQLESADRLRIGRVGDVRIVWQPDAEPGARGHVVAMVTGPEALAGRIHARLRGLLHRFLGGRWERETPTAEIEELGPTIRLRREARSYDVASGETWVGSHLVRRVPGGGRWPPPHEPSS
jgi:hypothetical protein